MDGPGRRLRQIMRRFYYFYSHEGQPLGEKVNTGEEEKTHRSDSGIPMNGV